MIKVLVVDDHPVVRDGLTSLFAQDPGFEVVGEAGNGADAVRLAKTLRPDVVLMDLRMPGTDGLTATRELAGTAHVLVLTTYDNDADVVAAIEAGATGYLLKDAPRDELIRAVRATARGEAVLAPAAAALLMRRVRTEAAPVLSARELEVLKCVAAGATNRDVAGATNRDVAGNLFITEATVKSHLLNIYAKLEVGDRAAAVTEAFHRGLLVPREIRDVSP
ncbi:response regulator [Lentzea sp. NPDC058450]|uniref:response regulator transcription factor n=1 Tax=Lentzea sp. NPDC058450 TaxID=3346505 RepID=UPI00364FD1A7